MKTRIFFLLMAFVWGLTASAQKVDSANLKSDIRSITKGKAVKEKSEKSLVRRKDSIPVKIDTTALKGGLSVPTPSRPNNPNPNNSQPGVVNPHPPTTPSPYPILPVEKKKPTNKKKKDG